MSFLGSRRVTDLEVHIPPTGGWLGYLHLEDGARPATGPATIKIGDLELVGTVLADRGGLDSPAHPSVVVAGGYGWRRLLPSPGGRYESSSGVRLLTVLRDLAGLAGELYDAPADVSLGPAYGWDASMATRPVRVRTVLADLVARGALLPWRVPPTGRTRFDAWPALPAADQRGRIVERNLALGSRTVALDTAVAAWLPGAKVQGTTIARTVFVERNSELRAKVFDA